LLVVVVVTLSLIAFVQQPVDVYVVAGGGGGGSNTVTDCIRTAACRSTSFSSKFVDASTATGVLQKHISIQFSAGCVYRIAY